MTAVPTPVPHAFLDRDGTIIREEHYLHDPARVALETGAVEGLRRLACAGFRLVVVSNQSGISRGLLSEADVAAVNARLAALLAVEGVEIASWHHCPHEPDLGCACRKPALGLFRAAETLCPVDWAHSIMVGDKPSDVEAGLALGMKAALVTTGHGHQHVGWARTAGVPVAGGLEDIAARLLGAFNPTPKEVAR